MRSRFVILLLIVMMLHALSDKTFGAMLTVVEFSHPPNYARCTDKGDAQQLTDGKLAAFPIWTKKEAVGWAALTPIAIQIRLGDGSSAQSPRAGTLRLHSVKGLSAGVDVPRQVDVYARDGTDKLRLVGSLASDSVKLMDKNTHWLDVEIRAATDTVVLVLHASGDYLFLDEVEWRPFGAADLPAVGPTANNVRAALADSTRRISAALVQAAETESARVALPLSAQAMHAWIQDPWTEIDPAHASEQLGGQPPLVDIRGYAGEHESVCLGIAVGKEIAAGGLKVVVSSISGESMKLFEVRPVMAANGKRVYDPLVPLKDGMPLTVRPGVPIYIWLDLNLAVLGPGTHRFEIHLEGRNHVLTIPAIATIVAYSGAAAKPLHAVNWAYLSDMPIFRNRDAAIRDLVLHGINTFVAHPSEIPGLALDGSWVVTQTTQFIHTVELAKQHGMLLLFLGWNTGKNPLGFSSKAQTLDPASRDRLMEWVGKISAYLANQGLPLDRWALYPVDEPDRDGLQLLKAVARAVKQLNPSIQIYADPSVYGSPPLDASNLRDVQDVVDNWQPNLLAVRGPLGNFFSGLQKEWWIYGNPKSPAKLGSPLHDYRFLAWWAWQYRASGVGFWSYSDTNGTSAWDDIDGRRPDWAVVYESDKGVVSSRRWEAFREGLEDYVLLSALSRAQVQEVLRASGEQDLDRWDSAAVERVRRSLLSGLAKAFSSDTGRR